MVSSNARECNRNLSFDILYQSVFFAWLNFDDQNKVAIGTLACVVREFLFVNEASPISQDLLHLLREEPGEN